MAITVAGFLSDRVTHSFAAHKIGLWHVLTDHGAEHCGKAETHACLPFKAVEDGGHFKTNANLARTRPGMVRSVKARSIEDLFRLSG